jgi:hypothetical protein
MRRWNGALSAAAATLKASLLIPMQQNQAGSAWLIDDGAEKALQLLLVPSLALPQVPLSVHGIRRVLRATRRALCAAQARLPAAGRSRSIRK